MKRSREHGIALGASEFAGGLNGEDGTLILNLLNRFVRTVRSERRLALDLVPEEEDSSDDDESMSSSEEDEESEMPSGSGAKRFKKDESWKEDTADYHVPFVGTSYSKGDTGTVVVGQWPTGLLQAYLRKSPLAPELVGDTLIPGVGYIHKSLLKTKQGRLSNAIYKAYLLALCELVTAAIPIEKLRAEAGVSLEEENQSPMVVDNASSYRFLPDIVKQRVPDLFALLKGETASGQGKATVVGGCGALAPLVLRIFSRLSATSTQTARHIARSLDASLPDGVLRLVFRPPNRRSGKEGSDKATPRDDARVAALELATTLLVEKDGVVASCIGSAGVKDRKIRPGILFLALKEGISETFLDAAAANATKNKSYLHAVARLLSALRLDLMNRPELLRQRALADLFSRDAFKNICDIAAHSPAFSDGNSFGGALRGSDSYGSPTRLERAGVEARRVAFLLLAEPSKSPFLQSSRVDSASHRTSEQQVVRAMVLLLDSHRGIEIQRFLLFCVETTPKLLPALFKALSFPDSRKTSAFLSRLNLVSRLVREGPRPSACVSDLEGSFGAQDADQLFLVVMPVGLKRHPLGKALQSSNPLVVTETLKLLVLVIRRFAALRGEVEKSGKDELLESLSSSFSKWLPDLQIVLGALSRFQLQSPKRSNVLVVGLICKVLSAFVSVLPGAMKEVKFDWIKLLPDTAESFCSAPHSLQLTLLEALKDTLDIREESPSFLSNACRAVLEIALRAKSKTVLVLARQITLSMFNRLIATRMDDLESTLCLEYEASCWIDGVTAHTLPELCKFLQEASQSSFQSLVAFAGAWTASSLSGGIPNLPVSSVLIHVMQRLPRLSPAFLLLTCQVAAKSLLFHQNPLPLATIVLHGQGRLSETPLSFAFYDSLCRYSRSLVEFTQCSPAERSDSLTSMVSTCFSPGAYPRALVERTSGSTFSQGSRVAAECSVWMKEDTRALVRQLTHVLLASDVEQEACLNNVKQILPCAIMFSDDAKARESLGRFSACADSIGDFFIGSEKLNVVSLSGAAKSKSLGDQSRGLECAEESPSLRIFDDITTSQLPLLSLVGPFLPPLSIVSCLIGLFDLCRTDLRDTRKGRAVASITQAYLKRLSDSLDHRFAVGKPFTDALVGTWKKISSQTNRETWFTELICEVEGVLCTLLAIDSAGLVSTAVYAACIRQSASRDILQLCLQNKLRMKAPKRTIATTCLLDSLVASDLALFAPLLLSRLAEDGNRSNLWFCALEDGWMDTIVLAIANEQGIVDAYPVAMRTIRDAMASRVLQSLSGKRGIEDFESAVMALNCLSEGLKEAAGSSQALALALTRLMTTNTKLKLQNLESSSQLQVLILASRLCGVEEVASGKDFSQFASALLLSLCSYTSFCLSNRGEKHLVSPSAWLAAFQVSSRLLESVLEKELDFEETLLVEDDFARSLRRLVRACLKHGVGNVEKEEQPVQPCCLRVVKSLLVASLKKTSSLGLIMSSFKKPIASQVHSMLTTHSQFRLAIASSPSEAHESRLSILQLLRTCISLVEEDIDFDIDIWQSLLVGYTAGMTDFDVTTRAILSIYSRYIPEGSDIGLMERLRWGGALINGQPKSGWDWFVDALEIGRIHETLRRYPVRDMLLPAAESVGDSSEQETQGNQFPVESLTQGGDRRYSVGFLLPSILAALESVVDSWGGVDGLVGTYSSFGYNSRDERDRSGPENHQPGVQLAQRLCEKGGLAIALASLCSRCASIRRTAVSILGLLTLVTESRAARQTPSWRERPQLAMVLNSVQRALTIKKGERASHQSKEESATEVPRLDVPRLPGVAAIFLARASLVVTNPGDNMFAAINRAFLKIQFEHGAFQDLNRLPVFISLFCSSSPDDPRQARRERMWAMELIKDGFVDEECYKTVESCRAPELLLTSIESFRSRSADDRDGECDLLLSTLWRILNDGGDRAAAHLIGRLGLLSWVRSTLAGRPVSMIFPDSKTRLVFIQLATLATHKAFEVLSEEEFVLATAGLAQPALDLYVGYLGGDQIGSEDQSSLVSATSDLLVALSSSESKPEEGDFPKTKSHLVQADGISLLSASRFLAAHSCPIHKRSSVLSLCTLPFRFENCEPEIAASFCKQALVVAAETELQCVLERIWILSTLFGESLDIDNSLLRYLLENRKVCVKTPSVRETWFKCVSELVSFSHPAQNEQELLLAKEIISPRD